MIDGNSGIWSKARIERHGRVALIRVSTHDGREHGRAPNAALVASVVVSRLRAALGDRGQVHASADAAEGMNEIRIAVWPSASSADEVRAIWIDAWRDLATDLHRVGGALGRVTSGEASVDESFAGEAAEWIELVYGPAAARPSSAEGAEAC